MRKYVEGVKKNRLTVFRREYTGHVFFRKHFQHVSKKVFKKDAHAEHVYREKKIFRSLENIIEKTKTSKKICKYGKRRQGVHTT